MTEYLKPSPCWLIWDKMFSEEVTFAQFEMAWTSFDSSSKKFVKNYNKKGRIHPTEKPIELYSWIIDKYAKQGYKIFDSHLGSGSSRIASYKMGYDFYACELDKEYFDAQEARFRQECFGEIKTPKGTLVQTSLF